MSQRLDTSNRIFSIAFELVNQSSRNIFLTGKAGTGKTSFLRHITQNCPKKIAVVAPTGVAAINAGAVTIHSFFQLPFTPFIPSNSTATPRGEESINAHSLISRQRLNKEKIKLLQEIELLVIDEVSMVRADTIDAIDTVLRHHRRRFNEPFGGVQVLFIGDLFQLPPVNNDSTWSILSSSYRTSYFFDSQVVLEHPPLYIEFEKIYRQTDEQFIQLLNEVRNNELSEQGRLLLESRYNPNFRREKDDGYIILTTHNDKARLTNTAELDKLNTALFSFNAAIENDFPEHAFPGDHELQLKEGAQVMFIKNDPDRARRYFNGKIGTVISLSDDKIIVRCHGEENDIEVKREKWENIKYALNPTTRAMEEEVLGSFAQYPLRLAWAITIHKSQGLTFEKAVIDAGRAFTPGQVYVALSRCTSLEGLVLQSRINSSSLATDPHIIEYARHASSNNLDLALEEAKRSYLETIIVQSFDFSIAAHEIKDCREFLQKHKKAFNPETLKWIDDLRESVYNIQESATKFHRWVNFQFLQPVHPLENAALLNRLKDATAYFLKEIEPIAQLLGRCPATTDSLPNSQALNAQAKEIFSALYTSQELIRCFATAPDAAVWLKKRHDIRVPGFSLNSYNGASYVPSRPQVHPELYAALKSVRDQLCSKYDLPIYMVASSKTLDELVNYLPSSTAELQKIAGFGKMKSEKFGEAFLEIIRQYCFQHDLVSKIDEKKSTTRKQKEETGKKPVRTKGGSKAESFALFEAGNSIADIAAQRKMSISTIETHLIPYVKDGQIPIDLLVNPDIIPSIEAALKEDDTMQIGSLKAKLGPSVSYGDIRFVTAHINRVLSD